MPTYESSKGGELLATGKLPTVPPTKELTPCPNHDHTHPTCLLTSNFACHSTHFFTKQKAFCSTSLIGVFAEDSSDLSEDRFPDIGPQGLSNILQHNCALFCNGYNLTTNSKTFVFEKNQFFCNDIIAF